MRRRVFQHVFSYFTAVGLLFFGYRCMEVIASKGSVSLLGPLIDVSRTATNPALLEAFTLAIVANVDETPGLSRFCTAADGRCEGKAEDA